MDLECGVYSELWGETIVHRITDVSEDGLWIEADLLLEVGTDVTLRFQPPDWKEALCVAGRVRRVALERHRHGSIGMGIAFDSLRPEERRQLTQSMRSLRAASPYLLGQRTLVGVPVHPGEVSQAQASTSEAATVVGWPTSARAPSSKPSRKAFSMPRYAPPGSVPMASGLDDDIAAFEGGLDLATSVFGGRRGDLGAD